MAIFKVEGGHRLHGSITPQGAKNEALQILCATLLTPERVTVHNIPQILDVMQLIELLRRMGVEIVEKCPLTDLVSGGALGGPFGVAVVLALRIQPRPRRTGHPPVGARRRQECVLTGHRRLSVKPGLSGRGCARKELAS